MTILLIHLTYLQLLDISKRLDAISGSNLQPEEATEIAALRMLMTVSIASIILCAVYIATLCSLHSYIVQST